MLAAEQEMKEILPTEILVQLTKNGITFTIRGSFQFMVMLTDL